MRPPDADHTRLRTPQPRRAWRLTVAATWAAVLALTAVAVHATRVGADDAPPNAAGAPAAAKPSADDPLARGADIYAFNCSTCHGATGLGFAEARSAFPSDHATCVRCHAPLNPAAMTSLEMERNQTAFSLGRPPPLADHERLARFGTAGALLRYVRATMPRWDPGRLSDEDYRDVTLHLLDMAGMLDAELREEAARLDAGQIDDEWLDDVALEPR
jgi:mono/diheme cytochrome c family protein